MGIKKKTFFKLFNLFLLIVFMTTTGFGCSLLSAEQQNAVKPITLTYWRVFDDQDAFDEVIKDYQIIHPNITVNYRKFRYEEYEAELLNALAEDRGPDIFSIPESWLRKYQTKLAPMPDKIKIGYTVEKTSLAIKKETVIEVRTEATPSLRAIKDTYTDTVYSDVIIEDQVYGLPLALETLVMFYNKDIMNQAGIAQIPTDWKTFQDDVVKMTKFESENKIIQSGTALGTGFNVERAFDIISVLMMQSGAIMSDSRGYPTFFAALKQGASKSTNPGLTAMQFYADFALPLKSVYSWNNSMQGSLQSFLAGKVGFFFGYNYHIPEIRAQSRVTFGIAPIPQIAGNPTVNYANYWLETVSKKSKNQNEAWDFILFMNKPEEIKKYLAKTNHPTAQKALIASQSENEDLYAASAQTLTAQTWYRGANALAAELAFKEMAEQFLLVVEPRDVNNVMQIATQKVSQTIAPTQ